MKQIISRINPFRWVYKQVIIYQTIREQKKDREMERVVFRHIVCPTRLTNADLKVLDRYFTAYFKADGFMKKANKWKDAALRYKNIPEQLWSDLKHTLDELNKFDVMPLQSADAESQTRKRD